MSSVSNQAVALVFFALGDETRLSLMRKLGAGTALSATVLSDDVPVTRQAIVKHLQVLDGAGLVVHQRCGREVLYTLEPRRLEEAQSFLEAISADWDRALARLRHMVEERPSRAQSRAGRRR